MATLSTGLEAWYRFDDDLLDSSGNGNHLSPVSFAPTYTDGVINRALMSRVHSAAVSIPFAALSVTVWFRFEGSTSGTVADVILGTAAEGTVIQLRATRATTDVTASSPSGGASYTTDAVPTNQWHHYVVLADGTGSFQVYADGSPVSGSFDGPLAGVLSSIAVSAANGRISVDLVGVWSRELTTDEVLELWNDGAAFDPTTAVANAPHEPFLTVGDTLPR